MVAVGQVTGNITILFFMDVHNLPSSAYNKYHVQDDSGSYGVLVVLFVRHILCNQPPVSPSVFVQLYFWFALLELNDCLMYSITP